MVLFLAFLPTLGPFEIALILVVGLLLFGARLPEVGKSLGKSLIELRRGMQGFKDQMWDLEREAETQVDAELARRHEPASGGGSAHHDLDAELRSREEDWRGDEENEDYGFCEDRQVDADDIEDVMSSEMEEPTVVDAEVIAGDEPSTDPKPGDSDEGSEDRPEPA